MIGKEDDMPGYVRADEVMAVLNFDDCERCVIVVGSDVVGWRCFHNIVVTCRRCPVDESWIVIEGSWKEYGFLLWFWCAHRKVFFSGSN